MKVHKNAEALIRYLEKQKRPVTMTGLTSTGISRRDLSEAIKYGVERGVFEVVHYLEIRYGEPPRYQWTGSALPPIENVDKEPSFDELLAAWGISHVSRKQAACAVEDLPRRMKSENATHN